MNDTNQTEQAEKDRCADISARVNAQVGRKDDTLDQARKKFMKCLDQAEGISALLRNCRDTENERAPLQDYHCEGIGLAIHEAVQGMCEQLDVLQDRYEDLLYDAKQSNDAPDALSAASVEVAQQFDTFDAEQQDAIRRVMREFPV